MKKNNEPSETEKRNNRVTAYLQKIYAMAQNTQTQIKPSKYSPLLLEVFNSKTISYREIVLTSLVAKYLDKAFNSHTNFYGCKPRAIYENPIKDFLIEHGFPCTKSGPLNIAKASNIDEAWSSQRDPKEDAEKTMILCDAISGNDSSLRQNLSLYLMRLYMSKAKEMEKLTVDIKPSSDPLVLHDLCMKLIEQAPDAGNTPQRIAGYLLTAQHEAMRTGLIVSGATDSASTTSTTSQKPGDINEEHPDGTILCVYEITIKPFNYHRILDSYDCVKTYNETHSSTINEITVICRKQDCPSEMISLSTSLCMGTYNYQDIRYYFWNIDEWISFTLQHMNISAREKFFELLNNYINDSNTHEAVKIDWSKLNS